MSQQVKVLKIEKTLNFASVFIVTGIISLITFAAAIKMYTIDEAFILLPLSILGYGIFMFALTSDRLVTVDVNGRTMKLKMYMPITTQDIANKVEAILHEEAVNTAIPEEEKPVTVGATITIQPPQAIEPLKTRMTKAIAEVKEAIEKLNDLADELED